MRITKRKTRALALASAAAIATLTLPAAPAASQGAGSATVAFDGTANLPTFPGSGLGDFDGNVLASTVAGVAGGAPVAGAGTSGTVTSTDFDYQEPFGCAAGTAEGDAQVSGTLTPGGETVSASTHFNWVRVGATAAIALTNSEVTVDGDPMISTGAGAGTAVFTVDNPETVCNPLNPPQGLDAHVTGAATIVGADA